MSVLLEIHPKLSTLEKGMPPPYSLRSEGQIEYVFWGFFLFLFFFLFLGGFFIFCFLFLHCLSKRFDVRFLDKR